MPPMLLVLRRPFRERLLECTQPEEEVLCLFRDGRRPVDIASRIFEFERIKDSPAVLALVPSGAWEAAMGARPFDIAVWEEALVRRAKRGNHRRLVDVAFVPQREEDLLDPRFVMRVGRVPVEIVSHAELLDVLLVEC